MTGREPTTGALACPVVPSAAGPMRRWHEPHPRAAVLLLLAVVLGACVVVLVSSLLFANWDLALGVAVVAAATGADLWRGLRPRQLVVAGPDGLVVRLGRSTTFLPWREVSGFDERRRRLRRVRPVVQRPDGSELPLPPGAPLEDLRHWREELAGGTGAP